MPNVVVVDMACFTTNPEKNPTLTAMALAARAAAAWPPMTRRDATSSGRRAMTSS